MDHRDTYAIGQQDFKTLREGKALYIDKTAYIEKTNFKSSAEHICLVFLTGVSRFSKLSVFSDLNNLNDISFSNEYADVCGITEHELLDNFQDGLTQLAREYQMSYDADWDRCQS